VVLEHQSRPAKALLVAEAGATGDADLGASGFGKSFLKSVLRPKEVDDQKQKDDKVFFDRVEVYMSERRYVVKVTAALLRVTLCSPDSKTNIWGDVGHQFVAELISKGWTDFAINLVDGIRSRWYEAGRNQEGLPGWVKTRMEEPTIRDQLAYAWEKQVSYTAGQYQYNQPIVDIEGQTFLEIIHLQQLLFLLLYKPAEHVNAALITKWFSLMNEAKFFDRQGRLSVGLIPLDSDCWANISFRCCSQTFSRSKAFIFIPLDSHQ